MDNTTDIDATAAAALAIAQFNTREVIALCAKSAAPEVLDNLTTALSALNDAEAELFNEGEPEEAEDEDEKRD